MFSRHYLAAALLFSALSSAQNNGPSLQPIWSITITTSAQKDVGLGCDPNRLGIFEAGGFDLSIASNLTDFSRCYNLADLVDTEGNVDTNPSDFVTVSSTSSWNSTAEYSRVGFSSGAGGTSNSSNNATEGGGVGRLQFETFASLNCDNGSDWTRWHCNDYVGDCAGLSYGVASFRISSTPADEQDNCLVAADRGMAKSAAKRSTSIDLAVYAMAFVGVLVATLT